MSMLDEIVLVFNAHIDLITAVVSFVGALCCVYLISVILKERTRLVYLQRWALAGLAVALLANSITFYPEWAMIQGHRPTGVIVDIMLMVVLIVMVVRGHVVYQPSLPLRRRRQDDSQVRN